MCQVFGVSRSGYYNWVQHEPSDRKQSDERLKLEIKVAADLTYVATQEGWLYLAGIKDVYTCEIVGYAMGERMTKELTGKALFMALRRSYRSSLV